MQIKNIKKTEFDPYYARYINKLSPEIELRDGLEKGEFNCVEFFSSIPSEKLGYQYAPGKWNIKEILQHLVDTERVFIYRCFRIARNDKTSLAGFDQEIYVSPSNATNKSIESILQEYISNRKASISLLNSLNETDLQKIGRANDTPMSARSAVAIILGHEIWHMDIIKEKYLN